MERNSLFDKTTVLCLLFSSRMKFFFIKRLKQVNVTMEKKGGCICKHGYTIRLFTSTLNPIKS